MPYTGNYISDSDIDNWQSGTTDAEKQEAIEIAEARLDAVLKTHYYPKPFDIRINGNGKNRLFLPLRANIQTVTRVDVNGLEIETSLYAFDDSSIFIDMTSSGSGWTDPELGYLLSEQDEYGIFPRGYNNIRIRGTYGPNSVPAWAKKAAKMLVEAGIDPTLYTTYLIGSETIGRYSYSLDAGANIGFFKTGVREVDVLIKPFARGKSIIMAP